MTKRVRSTIVLVVLLLSVTGIAPATTKAYAWSAWHTHYFSATVAECSKARQLAKTFIGPIQYYPVNGCYYRVRTRHAAIDTTSWKDTLVEIENTASVWPAWGMSLRVVVSTDGSRVKYDESSLWCRTWSFIVKVTKIECKVWNSFTDNMLIRMAYDASFVEQGLLFSVQRGAQVHVLASSGVQFVWKWP